MLGNNEIFRPRTFSPAIRGPVTTDDRERDEILHQKIQIFRWVKEEHLDIPTAPHNDQFLDFAKNGTKFTIIFVEFFILFFSIYFINKILIM